MVKIAFESETSGVIHVRNFDFRFSQDVFINLESFPIGRSWENRDPSAYVIHSYGTVLAIVFPEYYAYSEADALDAACDAGKLDSLLVTSEELNDYETGKDLEGYPEYEGIVFLGNASEPFASEHLEMFTVPAPLFADFAPIKKYLAENREED